MKAPKHSIVSFKPENEEEFIRDTLLSCHLIYVVLRDKDMNQMDVGDSLKSIKLIQGHLNKLEGLELTEIDKIKVGHYQNFSKCCEKVLEERLYELHKLRMGFIAVIVVIISTAIMCYILRG